MNPDKVYFRNLDAIRFFAALMVYLSHAMVPAYEYSPIQQKTFLHLLYALSDGRTGISIFFVLSGFLITYLLITEHERQSSISLKNFYIRRVLRIWPLYFLVVLISFLLYPLLARHMAITAPAGPDLFYNLAFLSNFKILQLKSICSNCNVPMPQSINWSISIEEQFYLLWPLLFVVLPKRFWVYAITLVIAGALWFGILNDGNNYVLYFHTIPAFVNLGVGGLLAYLVKRSSSVRTFFENSSAVTHFILFIVSFLLVFFRTKLFTFQGGAVIGQLAIAFSFALVISAQAITKKDSILNLKNVSVAANWGKYTYGIYLIHPLVLTGMEVLYHALNIPRNGSGLLISGLLGFALTLLLSRLCYRYFESGFLRLKEKFEVVKTGG